MLDITIERYLQLKKQQEILEMKIESIKLGKMYIYYFGNGFNGLIRYIDEFEIPSEKPIKEYALKEYNKQLKTLKEEISKYELVENK